jgi:hypothetical protein
MAPAHNPPPVFTARALRLERPAFASRWRLSADRPPQLDRIDAAWEYRARRTLVGIRGPVVRAVSRAEEAQLPIGRGERARHRGCATRREPRLHLMPRVLTHVHHGLEAAAKHGFGLQCPRAEPGAIARSVLSSQATISLYFASTTVCTSEQPSGSRPGPRFIARRSGSVNASCSWLLESHCA